MFSLIKTIFTFIFFYLVVSFPVADRPLFFYMNNYTEPVVKKIYSGAKGLVIKIKQDVIMPTTETIHESIYSNIDKISTKMSANKRVKKKHSEIKKEFNRHIHHLEKYTDEDKNKLLDLL